MAGKKSTLKAGRRRLLVVDDDPDVLALTVKQLELCGYEVFQAGDGVEGIRAVFEHKPDVILLDVMMPRLDGFQVCRFLKNYPPYDRIPIIFLTVRTGVGDRQGGLLRGGDDYLTKPLDIRKIRGKIEALAGSGGPPSSVVPGPAAAGAESISDLTAVMKLGEILDESLLRLSILEEISRAVAEADTPDEIIRFLLAGCLSDIGLGFDRAVFLVKSDDGRNLVGHTALGPFPEFGVSRDRWRHVVGRIKDKTLREVYTREMGDLPFVSRRDRPIVGELSLLVPNGSKVYDLTSIPSGEDIMLMTQAVSASAARRLGSDQVRAVPVTAKGRLLGALVVDNFASRRPVTGEDVKKLIILCHQAGLALEKSRLLEEQAAWARDLERLSNLNQSIIQAAGVGVVGLDPAGTVVIWNRAMAGMSGLEAKLVVGRPFLDVFPGLADSLVSRRLARVAETGEGDRVGHYQAVLGRRRGYFDIKMSPVVTQGAVQGVVLLVEDITRRVKLEARNREFFQYIASIVEHSADAIVTTDVRGFIRTWNRAAAGIFGWSEAEAKGRSLGIVFPRGRGGQKAEVLGKAAAGEVILDREISLHSRGGDRLYLSLTASPLRKADGKIHGVALFFRDVTERKSLVAQLVQTEKLASLGVMSAGMAHEINNPLASIVLHAQLLTMVEGLSGEGREYLEKIGEEVTRISEIVNDLLIYSRTRDKEPEKVDVAGVLNQAIIFIQRKTAAERIKVSFKAETPLDPINGIYNEILEIFLNILLNAADALDRQGGEIAVSASTVKSGPGEAGERPWLKVAIRDTGHGIPAAEIPKIFDPFYTTKPAGKGTGLGLMVVSHLVEEYGGRVKVESQPGRGTTFTVYLPCRQGGEGLAPA